MGFTIDKTLEGNGKQECGATLVQSAGEIDIMEKH